MISVPKRRSIISWSGSWFADDSGVTGSVAWPNANRAIFVPIWIEQPCTVSKFLWGNGATASGNIDAGIYTFDEDGVTNATLLASTGSTAQSGTSTRQAVDVTDFSLGRGTYYLALAKDDTTGTIFGTTAGGAYFPAAMSMAIMESAFPLPANATLATFSGTFFPIALGIQLAELTAP